MHPGAQMTLVHCLGHLLCVHSVVVVIFVETASLPVDVVVVVVGSHLGSGATFVFG